jgi:short-subunit dehydrogenase
MNVFIKGASGGLGRALANECGKRGYNLFLVDINEGGLKSIQRGLERQFNITVTTASCDLTSDASVDSLLDRIDEYGIRFDMLLNIAGVDYEGGFLEGEKNKKNRSKHLAQQSGDALRIPRNLTRRRAGHPFYLLFSSALRACIPCRSRRLRSF